MTSGAAAAQHLMLPATAVKAGGLNMQMVFSCKQVVWQRHLVSHSMYWKVHEQRLLHA
jgi:hypothetical protein